MKGLTPEQKDSLAKLKLNEEIKNELTKKKGLIDHELYQNQNYTGQSGFEVEKLKDLEIKQTGLQQQIDNLDANSQFIENTQMQISEKITQRPFLETQIKESLPKHIG